MIVFQPISYNDYLKYKNLNFSKIPSDLIQRGDFHLYLYSEDVKKIIENDISNLLQFDYMGFAILHRVKKEYIDYLFKQNGFNKCKFGACRQLLVSKQDVDLLNENIIGNSVIFDFFFNFQKNRHGNKLSNLELRKLLIMHYYNEWDPNGLLECDAPPDEYSGEIENICFLVNESTTTEQLSKIIQEVTEKMFGRNYFKKGTVIMDIANRIDSFIK